MNKNAFYFPHESNARNDEKILAVRKTYGAGGYAIYFYLLEMLMENSNKRLYRDYSVIAFDLRTETEKVKSIVEDFRLFQFTECGKFFYSEGFNRRIAPLDELREKRRIAGKKGAELRWQK